LSWPYWIASRIVVVGADVVVAVEDVARVVVAVRERVGLAEKVIRFVAGIGIDLRGLQIFEEQRRPLVAAADAAGQGELVVVRVKLHSGSNLPEIVQRRRRAAARHDAGRENEHERRQDRDDRDDDQQLDERETCAAVGHGTRLSCP
jgi:hypothetical protein